MTTLKSRRIIKDSKTEIVEQNISEEGKRILFLEEELRKLREKEEVDDRDVEINPDGYIKVMSLSPCILNLSTEGYGRGKTYKFTRFGEVKRIPYRFLAEIIEANAGFTEAGSYYIMDRDVIRRHGLDDIYSSILDKSSIDKIFSGNSSDALSLYKMSNVRQQEIIRDMLVDKLRDDENFDLNLIVAISKYSKVNLQEKAEDAKEFERLDSGAEEGD